MANRNDLLRVQLSSVSKHHSDATFTTLKSAPACTLDTGNLKSLQIHLIKTDLPWILFTVIDYWQSRTSWPIKNFFLEFLRQWECTSLGFCCALIIGFGELYYY